MSPKFNPKMIKNSRNLNYQHSAILRFWHRRVGAIYRRREEIGHVQI